MNYYLLRDSPCILNYKKNEILHINNFVQNSLETIFQL